MVTKKNMITIRTILKEVRAVETRATKCFEQRTGVFEHELPILKKKLKLSLFNLFRVA